MMKNKILFVYALPQEAKVIKKKLEGKSFFPYKIEHFIGGVGNYNMMYNLTDYFGKNDDIAFVVNIGVCGKKVENQNLIQIYKIKNRSTQKESLPPVFFEFAPLQSIISSESVFTHPDEMGEYHYGDMESYAVDFVCAKKNIPHIILKQPFDFVSEGSLNVSLSELESVLENIELDGLMDKMVTFLKNHENKEFDFSFFENKHRLTYSQGVFLKKYFQKGIAFGKKFEEIWKKLEHLEKKEFLIEIQS